MVDIKGLSVPKVLAALYNASRPLGLGFLHYDSKPMMPDEALGLLTTRVRYFDYLKGRVMKVKLCLGSESFDEWLYDRDNGQGAAQRVVDSVILTS